MLMSVESGPVNGCAIFLMSKILPSAGARIAFGSDGILREGSRKKYSVNSKMQAAAVNNSTFKVLGEKRLATASNVQMIKVLTRVLRP